MKRGLQLEIVSSLFVVMLAGTAVVAVVMASLAVQAVQRSALEQLELGARQLRRTVLLESLRLDDLATLLVAQGGVEGEGRWRILTAGGESVRADGVPVGESIRRLVEQAQQSGRAVEGDGLPIRDVVLIEPIVTSAGERAYLVGVVARERVWLRLRPLLRSGAWVLGISAVVFVVFGSYLLRERIVTPLRMLSAATLRVAAGELEVRTSVAGSNEIGELASRFNDMAASLERERDTVLQAFESLARSQRLVTVGELAAGVAHEVGNPVAAILGYVDVASRDPDLSERSRESIERIRAEALRVRALVRQLLDLARPETLELDAHAPGDLLRHVEALLRPQKILDGVELDVDVAPDLPRVVTDARRVHQIVINLVENAAHAVRDTAQPRIRLRASVSLQPFARGRRRSDLEALRRASSLVLEVSDNGPGIPDDIIDRIFDPFFTTREPGEGTGLGLWNAHRLAEVLGGRLEVRTSSDGASFSLILPLTDSEGGAT